MAGSGGFILVEISGGEQFAIRARQLATWGMSVQSLEPAWQQVGEDFLGDFALNMVASGGLFGRASRWPPLAPSTIREKARLGYGEMPPLWRTGTLAASLAEKGAAGNILQAGPSSLVVGTSINYARYHQDGTSRMPARQIVGISWTRRSGIIARLNAYVQELARRAGLAISGTSGE